MEEDDDIFDGLGVEIKLKKLRCQCHSQAASNFDQKVTVNECISDTCLYDLKQKSFTSFQWPYCTIKF